MNNRLDSPPSYMPVPRRILTAVGERLEGRWDNPDQWRILLEETAAAWCNTADVHWVLVCPRGVLFPTHTEANAESAAGALLWSAHSERVHGCPLRLSDTVWAELDARPPAPCHGVGAAPLNGGKEESDAVEVSWIAAGVQGGYRCGLAVVLGLGRELAVDPKADPLVEELLETTMFLAPLLGQWRCLADQTAALSTSRAECDTLSRLGDLRAHLAAVTAHELKTPLTSITAYAEVLEQQESNAEFAHRGEFLRVIRGEADRLLRLVNRLLDSSRRGRGPVLTDRRPVSIAAAVGDVLRAMMPQAAVHDLQLVSRIPGTLPTIDGDDDLVRQVLVNLLGNALKFTPAGGRVVIAAREEAAMVRLSVTDNGPGIAPRELRAIFQSFYRSRATSETEGFGLGLSIVKEITDLHGGHLDVVSRLGRGTTFSVLLPKHQEQSTSPSLLSELGFDRPRLQRIAELSLRLVSELAGARGVALLLPDSGGHLRVVAAMGLPPGVLDREFDADNEIGGVLVREPTMARVPHGLAHEESEDTPFGAALLAPFDLIEDGQPGLIVATRRLGRDVFNDDDLRFFGVLAETLGRAWSAVVAPGCARQVFDRVTDAVATLVGLRRGAIPTADPLAMRLLARTGGWLGLSSYEVRLLQYAGALHDAGMVLLDDDVVKKPETLDTDERDHVGGHPQRGLDVLGPLATSPELQLIIRHHHERVDGRGYPEGRRGDAIPLGARILAVIDAFFAMIRPRPWRDGVTMAAAVRELRNNSGTQFDEKVVSAFLGVLQEEGLVSDPVGTGPWR